MVSRRSTIRIQTRIQVRRTVLPMSSPHTKYYPTRRRRSSLISLEQLDSIQVPAALPAATRLEERAIRSMASVVRVDLVLASISKISFLHSLAGSKDHLVDAVAAVAAPFNKKSWLVIISRSKLAFRSWRQPRGPARQSTSPH